MKLERAAGGRQDLEFDGAVPIFVNRLLFTKFLASFVLAPTHDNILEAYLWAVLSVRPSGVRKRV